MEQQNISIAEATRIKAQLALASMGYKRVKSVWRKPVAFMILVAMIKDDCIEFSSMTKTKRDDPDCWDATEIGLNDEMSVDCLVLDIAYAESRLHIKEASNCGECFEKTFPFTIANDLLYTDM